MRTIATFSKPEEAHLLRMRLEDVGFRAFVHDEHMVQLDWFYSNAIGGVRVQVFAEDAEEVGEFLAADRAVPPGVQGEDAAVCPSCGSLNTAPDESARRVAYATTILTPSLLLLGPLLLWMLRRNNWKCRECHRVWNAGKRG